MDAFTLIVVFIAGMCVGIGIVNQPGTANQRWFFFIVSMVLVCATIYFKV